MNAKVNLAYRAYRGYSHYFVKSEVLYRDKNTSLCQFLLGRNVNEALVLRNYHYNPAPELGFQACSSERQTVLKSTTTLFGELVYGSHQT